MVKKFSLQQKTKKQLIVPIREEPKFDKSEEDDKKVEEKNNNEVGEKIGDVELPLIYSRSNNPIFVSRLDVAYPSKKNKNKNKK